MKQDSVRAWRFKKRIHMSAPLGRALSVLLISALATSQAVAEIIIEPIPGYAGTQYLIKDTETVSNLVTTLDGKLILGNYGNDTLTITDSSVITINGGQAAGVSRIGSAPDKTGILNITGTATTATFHSTMVVGADGTGIINVTDQATLVTDETHVAGGFYATDNGKGYVNIIGPGSTWKNHGTLYIGGHLGGVVTIDQQGTLSSQGIQLGGNDNSTGTFYIKNQSTVTGRRMDIGVYGHGKLEVVSGSSLSIESLFMGNARGATGSALVDGQNSQFVNSGAAYIAHLGIASVTVQNGGSFSNSYVYLANRPEANGTIHIRTPGSLFEASETLNIGVAGTGTLLIDQGATVATYSRSLVSQETGGTVVGDSPTGHGTVIAQNGSRWSNEAHVVFGNNGTGIITIESGSTLTSAGGYLGQNYGHGQVTITGANSLWKSSEDITIGRYGSGMLTLSHNGMLDANIRNIIVASETDSSGLINIGSAAGEVAVVPGNIKATDIIFGDGSGRIVFNHTSDELVFTPRITGFGLVDVYEGRTILLAGNNYTGDTNIHGGRWQAGRENAFSKDSFTTIHSAGILNLAGYNQTITDINNSGWIYTNTASGMPGVNLTVNTYVGNTANIRLNTYLGSDNSPSDKLVVTDTATGNTFLHISNIGGPGMATNADGILVVDAVEDATTTTDAFTLGHRVAAGAYEYKLYRGGSSSEDSWYLRNTLNGSPELPDYRDEVPLIGTLQSLAMDYGYAVLDTLHERVGDHFPMTMEPVTKQYYVKTKMGERILVKVMDRSKQEREKWFSGAWARVFGDRGFQNNKGDFIRNGSKYNYTFAGIQAGLDVYGREQKDGTVDKAGLYIAYGDIESHVKGVYGGYAGRINMNAYSLGAYWTHMSPNGWYTDAVIQGTWYDGDAKSAQGQKIDTDGFGFMASLEAGYEFKLNNGYTIEPQAQIIYQNLSFNNADDAYGRFSLNNAESLRGRIGIRFTKTWNTAEENKPPRLIKAWLRGNIWHEFMGRTKMNTTDIYGSNPLPFQSRLGGTWGEIGIGISGQISENTTLFATGSYNRSFDGKGREAWNGRLGMTVRW